MGGLPEKVFAKTLHDACKSGDVVWDVGANVGFYARSMAKSVGAGGKVFAFEPSVKNSIDLERACADTPNVVIFPFGLSSKRQIARFIQGTDRLGATSRVIRFDAPKVAEETEEIELRAGDDLIAAGEADLPNVVKIDVEGHELEVIEGLLTALLDPQLRCLLIEVHFALLAAAGRTDVPSRIEQDLQSKGFTIEWIDPSHLHARRSI